MNEAELREAAARHLARFAATEAQLARVLRRRIDRWQRAAALEPAEAEACARKARAAVASVVQGFVAAGAVNDAQFAASRAGVLTRAGKSRRAAGAWLRARGVDAKIAAGALGAGEELEAALVFARKRRMGPWRIGEADADGRRRDLARFGRGGFGQAVARHVMAMAREEAEAAVLRFRTALEG